MGMLNKSWCSYIWMIITIFNKKNNKYGKRSQNCIHVAANGAAEPAWLFSFQEENEMGELTTASTKENRQREIIQKVIAGIVTDKRVAFQPALARVAVLLVRHGYEQ